MCMSCGCGEGDKDHGDPRNITMSRLQEAAKAAKLSVHEMVENMQTAVDSLPANPSDHRGTVPAGSELAIN